MAIYSSWERFQDALRGRPKDRAPVFAGTTLWAASNYPEASFQEIASEPGLTVKAQLWARERIGMDALYPSADALTVAEAFGCGVRFPETGPLVDSLDITMDRVEDVEQLPIPDPRKTGRLPVVLEAARMLSERIRGDVPLVGAFEGAFTNTCRILETERVLRMIYRSPAVLDALLDRVNEFLIGFGRSLIESGVNAFFVPEPTASSTMISPRMFRQFVLPRLRMLTSRLDRPVILHICGDTQPILPAMAESGARALSLDQCMDLSRSRAMAPGMVLAGNVDPVQSLLMGDADSVRKGALRCLRGAGTERFILMPGCAVPPGTPVENLRAMVGAAVEFGLGS
ncbi:MAG: uroporphyrinogen decarboxylase family protein [Thermodesulfobacteriota bacterium]